MLAILVGVEIIDIITRTMLVLGHYFLLLLSNKSHSVELAEFLNKFIKLNCIVGIHLEGVTDYPKVIDFELGVGIRNFSSNKTSCFSRDLIIKNK
jgi:hypothetical protein